MNSLATVEALGFKMLEVVKKTVFFLTMCQQKLALDGADIQILVTNYEQRHLGCLLKG